MMTKKGIITNSFILLIGICLTVLGIILKNIFLIIIPLPIVILYIGFSIFAMKYYEKAVIQLNKDTKAFQESLNLREKDEIVYLNEKEFKTLRKEGKLYRGKDKAPMILGDKINDHSTELK